MTEQMLDDACIGPGMRVLDIGCGPGTGALMLSQRVGSQGHVFAVDRNPRMLDAAGTWFFSFQTAAIPVGEGKGTANIAQSILHYTYVQLGYFETLRIPLFLGRGLERETQNGQFVVLSESAAKHIFRGENPLGRSIRLGVTDERTHSSSELIANGSSYQGIGVARDTRGSDFAAATPNRSTSR